MYRRESASAGFLDADTKPAKSGLLEIGHLRKGSRWGTNWAVRPSCKSIYVAGQPSIRDGGGNLSGEFAFWRLRTEPPIR